MSTLSESTMVSHNSRTKKWEKSYNYVSCMCEKTFHLVQAKNENSLMRVFVVCYSECISSMT